jgi:thioredoxin-like negative regulator of GroEL
LIRGNDPFLARVARAARFQGLVNTYVSVTDGDADHLQTALEELLQDPEAGAETFRAAREAAGWLIQAGRLAPAADAITRIGQRFANDADENLAAEAAKLLSQSTNLQLSHLARGVLEGKPEALDQLSAAIQNLLQSDSADPNRLAYVMQTAQMLEYAGHPDAALKAYGLILEHYQAQPESQTGQTVRRTVELARTRLGLIGQPLAVDGVLLNGSVFDWQDYRGKPVLIVFWTTWYENWLQDVEQLRNTVRDYRPQGLEVITINLDDDRNVLERFLQTNPMPWPIVVNPDPLAAGFENPNAIRCGVEAVPLAILVDKQAVVTDLHVLGNRLAVVLKQRLGGEEDAPAEEPKP